MFTNYYKLNTLFFNFLCLFTRGRWVVKKGQNSVNVSIEWPQKGKLCIHVYSQSIVNGNIRKMFSSSIKSYLVIISLKSRELVAKHATIISGVSNMPTFIHFGNQLIIKIISY